MTTEEALDQLQYHINDDPYHGLAEAINTVAAAIQRADDFYALAEKFACANDDWWAAIKSGQLEDINALYNARENAAQALALQLRTRRQS